MSQTHRTTRAGPAVPAQATALNSVPALVAAVQDGIRRGRYVPGQRLVEADLAQEYGVKRTAVRDALRMLAGDGIVELVPQRGARIRRMSHDDLRALVPVLAGLLRTTVRLAIVRVGDPGVGARLEEARAGLRHAHALRDFVQFQAAALRYTTVLHEAADNRYLDYLHAKLHPEIFHKQLGFALQATDWEYYFRHFEALHAALLAGNLGEALALVDDHEARLQALFVAGTATASD